MMKYRWLSYVIPSLVLVMVLTYCSGCGNEDDPWSRKQYTITMTNSSNLDTHMYFYPGDSYNLSPSNKLTPGASRVVKFSKSFEDPLSTFTLYFNAGRNGVSLAAKSILIGADDATSYSVTYANDTITITPQ